MRAATSSPFHGFHSPTPNPFLFRTWRRRCRRENYVCQFNTIFVSHEIVCLAVETRRFIALSFSVLSPESLAVFHFFSFSFFFLFSLFQTQYENTISEARPRTENPTGYRIIRKV